jgi:hypothetical protein
MKTNLQAYFENCITLIEKTSESTILNSVGQMINSEMKIFVKNHLKTETLQLLKIF